MIGDTTGMPKLEPGEPDDCDEAVTARDHDIDESLAQTQNASQQRPLPDFALIQQIYLAVLQALDRARKWKLSCPANTASIQSTERET